MIINTQLLLRGVSNLPIRGRRFALRCTLSFLKLMNVRGFAPYLGSKVSMPLDEVYLPWSVGGMLSRADTFEPDTTDTFAKFVQERFVVLDIGANIGATTVQLSRQVGSDGTVYAFEPHPTTFKHLVHTIELSNLLNVKPIPTGLGDNTASVTLQFNPTSTGWGSVYGNGETYTTSTQVSIVKLDDFVIDNNVQRVDFIKIDVEGYELEVMRGGRNTIDKYKPIIQFEYNKQASQNGKWTFSQAYDLLSECGYKSYVLTDGTPIDRSFDIDKDFVDVIARP
jgi:FkbM family methyltransferase